MLSVGVRGEAVGERGGNMQPKGTGTTLSPHCCPGWDRHCRTFPLADDGIPDGLLAPRHQSPSSPLRPARALTAWSGRCFVEAPHTAGNGGNPGQPDRGPAGIPYPDVPNTGWFAFPLPRDVCVCVCVSLWSDMQACISFLCVQGRAQKIG